ncbi:MAG: hypothetical protein KF799_15610 [Bdellovibrionales bacterium]|nr:hypothetical protein [Bdellovibrionales bacterium]
MLLFLCLSPAITNATDCHTVSNAGKEVVWQQERIGIAAAKLIVAKKNLSEKQRHFDDLISVTAEIRDDESRLQSIRLGLDKILTSSAQILEVLARNESYRSELVRHLSLHRLSSETSIGQLEEMFTKLDLPFDIKKQILIMIRGYKEMERLDEHLSYGALELALEALRSDDPQVSQNYIQYVHKTLVSVRVSLEVDGKKKEDSIAQKTGKIESLQSEVLALSNIVNQLNDEIAKRTILLNKNKVIADAGCEPRDGFQPHKEYAF